MMASNYEQLVKALRCCGNPFGCNSNCQMYKRDASFCRHELINDAAAAIEELLSFAHYVANKVTMSDEDWEDYHEAFTEVACRKLVKLGVIFIEDDMYVYKRDEPHEVQDGQA